MKLKIDSIGPFLWLLERSSFESYGNCFAAWPCSDNRISYRGATLCADDIQRWRDMVGYKIYFPCTSSSSFNRSVAESYFQRPVPER